MSNKCLYCYKPIEEGDFHKKCSIEFFGTPKPPVVKYSLNQMDELAKKVVERSVAVPGVQAKLSMSLVREEKEKSNTRLTVIDALGGFFILKPPSDMFAEMPENEHLTMRIAKSYGIQTVPSSLIRLASGELSYITKRIDRTETGGKIHMLDMFQITEAFDKYKSSIEKVGKSLKHYSSNTLLDALLFFELVLFSFITGNNDMHLKNFSMIERASGWCLSPAYDLLNVAIILPEDNDELALSLSGKRKKIKLEDFTNLAQILGITNKQINGVYSRLKKNKDKAIENINNSFLSKEMQESYKDILDIKYKQLFN